MDSAELRLECLRLAADRQLPEEDVVNRAQRFLDFVLRVGMSAVHSACSESAQSEGTQHTCRELSRE